MQKISARDIAYIALFTALMAICAWITIPFAVPFTMQTFAVMLAAAVLGARRAVISTVLYLALGMIGIPVFSGFAGGAGVLLGPTGGYLIGFVPAVLITAWLMKLCREKYWAVILAMACGMVVCYTFGTAWHLLVYLRGAHGMAMGAVLMECVVPFILPDIAKMCLAAWMARRFKRIMGK